VSVLNDYGEFFQTREVKSVENLEAFGPGFTNDMEIAK
jgi:hypothetical protein